MTLKSLVEIYISSNVNMPLVIEPVVQMDIVRDDADKHKCCAIRKDGLMCQIKGYYNGFCYAHRNVKVAGRNC